eukprot:TRINITY_DN5473_c0_g1_i1.p1 TRINITY_DN5473_c0_g1~~TRINITY_DN5473_c0_g1_i1.p1  ORF type:complete len:329 (-),score=74.60 TRINITY_DN5473_c0_g1_i1:163-1086(-)
MCGRVACTSPPDILSMQLNATMKWKDKQKYQPSYNLAPGKYVPVLTRNEEKRQFVAMRWGFDLGCERLVANARAQTLKQKPTFLPLLKNRRCVVVFDGFFEWETPKTKESRKKKPYFCFSKNQKPFAAAGLFNELKVKGEPNPVLCVTIITVDGHPAFRHIHDRMPAFLDFSILDIWLNPGFSFDEVFGFLRPADFLSWYPVSWVVNDPNYDLPACIKNEGNETFDCQNNGLERSNSQDFEGKGSGKHVENEKEREEREKEREREAMSNPPPSPLSPDLEPQKNSPRHPFQQKERKRGRTPIITKLV